MSINYGRIQIRKFSNCISYREIRETVKITLSFKQRGSHVAVPVVEHIEPGSSKDSIIGYAERIISPQTGSKFESVPRAARSNSVLVFLG